MAPAKSVRHLADERTQHLLRDVEIENGPRSNRSMNFDATRFAAEKFHCLMAHANNFPIVAIDRHNRRFVQEDASVGLIDEGVDSTKIDGEFVLEKLLDELHGDGSSSKSAGRGKRVNDFPGGNSYA